METGLLTNGWFVICAYDNRQFCQIRSKPKNFLKILQIFWLNPDGLSFLWLGWAIGRVLVRPAKLPEPQELPSGYLKHSALAKSWHICHVGQPSDANKLFDIKEIHKCTPIVPAAILLRVNLSIAQMYLEVVPKAPWMQAKLRHHLGAASFSMAVREYFVTIITFYVRIRCAFTQKQPESLDSDSYLWQTTIPWKEIFMKNW